MSVAIPDGVTSIDTCTFSECAGLNALGWYRRKFQIVTSQWRPFQLLYNCYVLIDDTTIPDGATFIGDSAFFQMRWDGLDHTPPTA